MTHDDRERPPAAHPPAAVPPRPAARAPAGAAPHRKRPRRRRVPMIEFEHRGEPLLPLGAFWGRMIGNAFAGLAALAVSLLVGVLGYHTLGRLGWVDSILNASMILGGMGPVDHLETAAAKLFASAYALFSGVAFIAVVGILLAPVVHRLMHTFHLALDEDSRE